MLVSIVTPVLNCKKYVRQCIDSVIHQDYPQVEHILVDGGSTDGTLEIIKEYTAKFPGKVRLINQIYPGIGGAWNQGIDNAYGEILGWLGGDDVYVLNAARLVVEYFEANSDVSLVYGGENFIDENGTIIVSCPPEPFDYATLLNKKQIIYTTSTFYRKNIINVVGKLDSMGDDYDFYLRIGKKFKIQPLNHILSSFRIHENSQTNGANIQNRKKWLKAWCQTCRRHGGSKYSVYCLKYYLFLILGWALPIWNYLYFFMLKHFRKKIL